MRLIVRISAGVINSPLQPERVSITERGTDEKMNAFDDINFTLIALALLIEGVALSAIGSRCRYEVFAGLPQQTLTICYNQRSVLVDTTIMRG